MAAGDPTLDMLATFTLAELNTRINDATIPTPANTFQLDQTSQVAGLTEQASPVITDLVTIEEASGGALKKTKFEDLPFAGSNAISVLNPGQNAVNLAAVGDHQLYQVPAGKDLIVMGCFIACTTYNTGTPSCSLGITASAYADIYEDQALTGLAQGKVWSMLPGGLSIHAGDIAWVYLRVNTAATATTEGIPYLVGYVCDNIM
jgi:hypothetical protein